VSRKLAYGGGFAVLATSGVYLFVYLYRWEWNRAVFAGVIFIATEVAMAAMAILERVGTVSTRLEQQRVAEPALTRLRETAPPPRDPFGWLKPRGGELGIFVPVLMGAGVVASALAWLIERLARRTARPVLEKGLALRLTGMAWPDGGLLAPEPGAATSDAAATTLFRPLAS
jgi:hypothetical protein